MAAAPAGCTSYLQERHILVAHLPLHRLHQPPQSRHLLPDVSALLLDGSDLLLLLGSQGLEPLALLGEQRLVEPLELQADLLLRLLGLVLVTARHTGARLRSMAVCDQQVRGFFYPDRFHRALQPPDQLLV